MQYSIPAPCILATFTFQSGDIQIGADKKNQVARIQFTFQSGDIQIARELKTQQDQDDIYIPIW